MTKPELIAKVAEEAGITRAAADRAYNAIFNEISRCVAAGESYSVMGFATFSSVEVPAREGRNPSNGETIQIPACKKMKVKVSSRMKEYLN